MKKLVIFDFDGVLIDTLLMCYELNKANNPDHSWQDFKEMSHGNFYTALRSGIKNKKFSPHPDFHTLYGEKICDINIPPILKELVIKLAKDNSLSIVTSGYTLAITDHLKREGIDKYFDEILGFDFHVSKVVKLNKLLNDHSISSNDCVFITDTLGDILEANECKIKSIAVTWGLHEKETLEKGNPALIIDNPIDLESAINSVLK